MVVQDDIRRLIEALNDEDATILLLSGLPGTQAAQIQAFLEGVDALDEWHRHFWIANLGILEPEQRNAWFEGNEIDRYVVLGGTKPKVVASSGDVSRLLGPDNEPSIMEILLAFAEGDRI